MKKIIGILGVVVIAVAMFFSTNAMNNSNGNFDLASLLALNTANAECNSCPGGINICRIAVDCGTGSSWYGTYVKTEVFCYNGQGARTSCTAKSCS